MAAIGKIREHGGFLTVIIGLALASFVIGPKALDLIFKSGPEFDRTAIAIVNGEKIDIDYFNSKVEEQVENFKQQNKKDNLTSEERFTLTMQVWDMVKKETLLHQQELEIGLVRKNENNVIAISRAEYTDMIIGKNPHQLIVQNFSDQKTGQFNPQYVKQFLTNVEQGLQSQDPKQVEQAQLSDKQWKNLAQYIKEDRLSQKYYNLIKKAYYIPTALAKQEYIDRNATANVRYTAVRYGTIKDEDAVPTDADYQEYFAAHQNEFEQNEETRKIDYVVWNVRPSQKDIQDIQKQINDIATEFKTIDINSIPVYVNSYRDSRYDSTWRKSGELSPFIDSIAFNSEAGTIMGPWTENNAYSVARLVDVQMRPDSMRASYILVTYSGAYGASDSITRTRIGASALADSLMEVAKTGDFEELAKAYSDDPNVKENGGDLDWFADGQTAPEINKACLENNIGDVIVTEGAFGFLVLKVTGKQEEVKKVRVAQINIPITYSKETHNLAFTEATRFASRVSDAASFDSVSTNLQLNVMKGDFLKEMDANIMGIPNSRSIIRWMFEKDVVKGSISDVFDYDNQIIVAILSDIRAKGIPAMEDVKDYIKPLVIRDVKAKQLISKLAGVSDINQFASSNNIIVDTATMLTYNTYSLPKYGPEQNVQGHMFASEIGAIKGPLKGDQGVYVFVVDGMNPAPENTVNYQYTKQQVRAVFEQMVDQAAYNAIDKAAEISDFRKYVY
jgi:peptidyl-prolyl cis-trans isomerase D